MTEVADLKSIKSNDKIDKTFDVKVPPPDENQKPEDVTVKSYSSSMVPQSDRNAALIMTHIPVQDINEKKYTLPENKQ